MNEPPSPQGFRGVTDRQTDASPLRWVDLVLVRAGGGEGQVDDADEGLLQSECHNSEDLTCIIFR